MMSKSPSKPILIATFAVLCIIWGTTWAVIQIGLEGIPPFSGVAIRFAIAGFILLAVARLSKVRLGSSRNEKILWVVNGLLSFCISYGVVYWAEQWVPSGLAAVLFATYPLFVALLAHFTLPGESLSLLEVIGVLFGFLGVAVIFSEDFSALGGRQVAIASAIMLISPLVSAVASVSIKRWGAGIHPLSLTIIPMAMAAVLTGSLAVTMESGARFDWNARTVSSVLYLAVFGSMVTFSLYFWLLERLPAKRVALIAYIIPVVAVGIGVLRGEPLTPRILAGAAIVIVSVAVTVQIPATARA